MTYAANALHALRDIPTPALLAIVHHREYAYPVCVGGGPLPDEVVEYLTTNPELCGPLYDKPLYQRHFSAVQRARILAREHRPHILETIIEYNTLTLSELDLLSPSAFTYRLIVQDLLNRHAKDPAAVRRITSKISSTMGKELGVHTILGRAKLHLRIPPAGVYNVPPELPGDLAQFCPIDATIAEAFTIAVEPIDALPLSQILGTSPAPWLAFLRALDSAPPNTTLRHVAATVTRLKFSSP